MKADNDSIEGQFKAKLLNSEFSEAGINFGDYINNNLEECAARAVASSKIESNVFERAIIREFNLESVYIDKLNCGFANSKDFAPEINYRNRMETNPLTDFVYKSNAGFVIIETDEGTVATDGTKFIMALDTWMNSYKLDKHFKFSTGTDEPEIKYLTEKDSLVVGDIKYQASRSGLKLLEIVNFDDSLKRLQGKLMLGSLENEFEEKNEVKLKNNNKLKS